SLEALTRLLAELKNQKKTQNDPATPKPEAQDPHRTHQVILSGKGPVMYASRHPGLQQPMKEEILPSGDKRNIKLATQLWDNGTVRYTFSASSNISMTNQEKIRKMMDKIEKSTCITWEYVQPNSKDYHVQIVDGIGCYSQTGNVQSYMSGTGHQNISLEKDGCMDNGTILHELCHTLGLEHVQSRPDRDTYITIDWDNVLGGQHNPNMEKKPDLVMFNIPFDQSSVMLYTPYSMAKHKGTKTYVSTDPMLDVLSLEDHQDLSFYDKLLINRAYDCAGHCDPKDCKHGEFLSEDCTCTCPDGLTGELCESVIQEGNCTDQDHKVVIGSIGETITVKSSGYPNSYPTGSKCRWLVQGPKGSKLRVTMLDMDIASAGGPDDSYCLHSMELRYNLIAQPGPEFCGNNDGKVMTFETADYSEANTMILSFDTTNKASSDGHKGFKLNFTAIQGNDDTKAANFCKDSVCKNGGTCKFNDNSYWCDCVSGFRGRNCDHGSDQNDQSDQNTVFLCDNTDTGECNQFDLGTAWEIDDNGHFVVKSGQQGNVELQIPYTITHLNNQYCLHVKMSRLSSTQQETCSQLNFFVKKEMEISGFHFVYDDLLWIDHDCTARSDDSFVIGFTSQHTITEMKFQMDITATEDANIALSDFRLEKAACSTP
ncbi:protein SpAN-like, partial [Mizuhopecten yessoensis]